MVATSARTDDTDQSVEFHPCAHSAECVSRGDRCAHCRAVPPVVHARHKPALTSHPVGTRIVHVTSRRCLATRSDRARRSGPLSTTFWPPPADCLFFLKRPPPPCP